MIRTKDYKIIEFCIICFVRTFPVLGFFFAPIFYLSEEINTLIYNNKQSKQGTNYVYVYFINFERISHLSLYCIRKCPIDQLWSVVTKAFSPKWNVYITVSLKHILVFGGFFFLAFHVFTDQIWPQGMFYYTTILSGGGGAHYISIFPLHSDTSPLESFRNNHFYYSNEIFFFCTMSF